MASFIIHDQDGKIITTYTVSPGMDASQAMADNTPEGMLAVAVEDRHPAILGQMDYLVSGGKVVKSLDKAAQMVPAFAKATDAGKTRTDIGIPKP